MHKTSKDYQVSGVMAVSTDGKSAGSVYNLQGVKQTGLRRGINIVNGKKIFVR